MRKITKDLWICSKIYNHDCQQCPGLHKKLLNLGDLATFVAILAMFSVNMHRNVYLAASGKNPDISIRLIDRLTLISLQCVKFRRFQDVFRWLFHRKSYKSAIFLLLVYFTYWLRQRATYLATHDDNSHQVWSWYDYLSPSYGVVAANTLRDLEL